ncbi:amidase [Bradyrhizobium sp. S3.2.6]|uniref:Indoleacetamide hydrolase n=1 Tax=Bradyrhizobium japonicum TaxID=375 RepID=A0A1Y2JU98_BRAJP|nr:amidase [Bradyrhizobium japonicum]OSJ34144.1 amidase [Bradyrhizobium japonicum]
MLTKLYKENDAVGLSELVRKGDVAPLELVEQAIHEIERLNPRLNAVTARFYDQARKTAAGPLPNGPLAGVPFLLKDLSVEWKGFPVTNGCRYFKDYVATSDWEIARRVRNAGLIPLGKTNVPENGWCISTEPKLFGPTINPWNANVSAGGSSGGSAVAVASGMVPLAEASDGGGSIRVPASNNGLVGLKPSRGRVTFGPDVVDYWYGAVVFLCVSRTVRDTAAYLDAVAGAHPGDPYALSVPATLYLSTLSQAPRRLRIGLTTRSPDGSSIHPDVRKAIETAAKICGDLGHGIEEHDLIYDVEAFKQIFARITGVQTAAFFNACAKRFGRPVTPKDVESATWGIIELGKAVSGTQHSDDIEAMRKLSRKIVDELTRFDLYLAPVLPVPPRPAGWYDMSEPDIHVYNERLISDIVFTAPFNCTGQPAITVPVHYSAENVPIAVQFVGRIGDEATLLRLAAQIETAYPWRDRHPPDFEN